jgi:pilus assembly protein CpaE
LIVIADSDREFRARVIEQAGRDDVIEARRMSDVEKIVAERRTEVRVVLLGPSFATSTGLALAAKFQVEAPEIGVIIAAKTVTADLLRSALHAGARDVLPYSFTPEQLAAAVARADSVARHMRENISPVIDLTDARHRVVTVHSSKGGVGKSFVASNLAVLLAQRGNDVVLVDLDLQSGDLALMLQLHPRRTLYDATRESERLDEAEVRGYLTRHPASGLSLLAAPTEPGLAETITAESVQSVLRVLKSAFQYVVIDTPPLFTDHVLAAIDETDVLVSVTAMDVPSIKNLRVSLQTFELLGVRPERMALVLNRADSKVGLSVGEVEKALRATVDVCIPSSRDVPLSVNRGNPIALDAPKSAVTSALTKIAELVDEVGKLPPPRRSIASKLGVGRKR